jgi:hypothetical protein
MLYSGVLTPPKRLSSPVSAVHHRASPSFAKACKVHESVDIGGGSLAPAKSVVRHRNTSLPTNLEYGERASRKKASGRSSSLRRTLGVWNG